MGNCFGINTDREAFRASDVYLSYYGDDGEAIHLSSNRDLEDAVIMAKSLHLKCLFVFQSRDKKLLPKADMKPSEKPFSFADYFSLSRSESLLFAPKNFFSLSLVGLGAAFIARRILA